MTRIIATGISGIVFFPNMKMEFGSLMMLGLVLRQSQLQSMYVKSFESTSLLTMSAVKLQSTYRNLRQQIKLC